MSLNTIPHQSNSDAIRNVFFKTGDRDLLSELAKSLKKDQSFLYKDYDSLGRKRESMPQISSDDIDSWLMHFSKKAKVKKESKKLKDLKPSQCDFNDEKIISMLDSVDFDPSKRTYLVSKDGYIIDGHHSWACGLEIDNDCEVTCYVVNIKAKELLRRTNIMKISKKVDINDNAIKKSLIKDSKASFTTDLTQTSVENLVNLASNQEAQNILSLTISDDETHFGDFLVFSRTGGLLILRRAELDDLGFRNYCLPGGHIDQGESIKNGAERELLEETNLIPDSSIYVKSYQNDDGSYSHYFACIIDDVDDDPVIDATEHIGYEWIDIDDINKYAFIFDLRSRILEMIDKEELDHLKPIIDSYETMSKAFDTNQIDEETFHAATHIFDSLMKSKPAAIGERRVWGNKEMVKTSSGWVPVSKNNRGKKEDQVSNKKQNSGEEKNISSYSDKELKEYAKKASEQGLENTIKESGDEKARKIAHEELDRRKKEEHV